MKTSSLLTSVRNSGGTLAAAHAHGYHAVLRGAAAHFAQNAGGEFCSGAAERVAESDRAAVHVYDLLEPGAPNHREGLNRERFVQLDQIDVARAPDPASASAFGMATTGPMPMISGGTAGYGIADEARRGLKPEFPGRFCDMTSAAAAPSLVCESCPRSRFPAREIPASVLPKSLERRIRREGLHPCANIDAERTGFPAFNAAVSGTSHRDNFFDRISLPPVAASAARGFGTRRRPAPGARSVLL